MEKKSFKQFGVLDIRSTIIKPKKKLIDPSKRIQLTSIEISELLIEGIFTVLVLLLLNVALLLVISISLNQSNQLFSIIYFVKEWAEINFAGVLYYSWQKILIVIFLILDTLIVYWRLKRRLKQIQLNHIISELHYISMGHFEHRIPFELPGDLGNVVDSINVLVDSTLKAMEDERAIERSKDDLITNVSHDIRTPLTSIIGYLGLIEEQSYSNGEELKKFAHTAYTQAKQMNLLLNDLFEYTKVRHPNTKLNKVEFDLMKLMAQVAIDFEFESDQKNIDIIVAGNQEQIPLFADPEKLVRVFYNIVSNAMKYGTGLTQIQILAQSSEETVKVAIRNDGIQIPDEKLPLLFDRFYRADASRNNNVSGSGLGLAIALSIIDLHHGEIHVESNEEWTTFYFILPKK
ncbi:MAG: HAMP domain-containing histidine kinase [Streptococcaceae bacterium]|jgi:signal transduction histidine kinase|nr:HAMP domain-containing histidine kinase [Streptococcaceae bacterium]